MSELVLGSPAPAFSAPDQTGKNISLADLKGHIIVLYFYPKDDTPGCTTEACSFRDEYAQFQNKGVIILGVSPDDAASHQRFVDKFKLPFQLLADTEKKMAQAYGVWVEKSMYGKKYMGVERSTFVIDTQGKLQAIHRKVKPNEHISELLATL